jgi:HEAT repeat protein
VRRYLGAALGASGDERAAPALLKLLHDPDPDPFIKIWAAHGLGNLGHKKTAVTAMMNLLLEKKAGGGVSNVMGLLEELTGQKLPGRSGAWREWWTRTGRAEYSEG